MLLFSPTVIGGYLYTCVCIIIYANNRFSNYTTLVRNINICEGVGSKFPACANSSHSYSAMSSLLKGPGSTKFADKWPDMQPVVLKLLKQEHVTRDEWQNLFW